MALPLPTASVGRANHVVQSARNGLMVSIPTDARGVVPRFFTRGDNELVFAQPKGKKPAVKDTPVALDVSTEAAPPEGETSAPPAAREIPPKKRSKLEDFA